MSQFLYLGDDCTAIIGSRKISVSEYLEAEALNKSVSKKKHLTQ